MLIPAYQDISTSHHLDASFRADQAIRMLRHHIVKDEAHVIPLLNVGPEEVSIESWICGH